MVEKFNKFKEEAGEIKALVLKQLGKESVVRDMTTDEFEMLQHALKVIDYAMDLSEEQAKTLERIETKLDELLVLAK